MLITESGLRIGESPLFITEPGLPIRESPLLITEPGLRIRESPLLITEPGIPIRESPLLITEPGLPIGESPLLITTRSSRERFAHVNNRTIIYTNHLSLFVILHDCVVFLSNRIAESIYIIAMFCNP